MPKDDIQAFKIINEMVYKPEIENVLSSNIVMNYDAKRYGNELINKLLQSKYLTREDTLNLIKFMFKDGYDKGFKGKHELLDD